MVTCVFSPSCICVDSVFTLIAFPFLFGLGSCLFLRRKAASSSFYLGFFSSYWNRTWVWLFVQVVWHRVYLRIYHQAEPSQLPSEDLLLENQSCKELSPLLFFSIISLVAIVHRGFVSFT
ncbi:MAG: hypothetical protein CM15mV28_0620 [Thaumasvirus sp.]|nr:MAG: hypothetical protein CM15mV28_0620 [Thaumasvirus sp.]